MVGVATAVGLVVGASVAGADGALAGVSIADLVGGDWPELARQACEEMIASGGQPPEDQDKLAELEDIMNGWGALDAPMTDGISKEE